MGSQNTSGQDPKNTTNNSPYAKLIGGRNFFDGLGKSYPVAEDVKVEEAMINNISCYWFNPKQPLADKLIIYLHGGGFAWGSIRSHKALVSHIAEQTGTIILFIEYALAPEGPYPQGVSDLIKIYRNIIAQLPRTEIFLMGDSAGGGLVVSAIRQLQQDGIHQPNGVVLISPWLNLSADTPSYTNNAPLDPILTVEVLKEYAEAYNPHHLREANPSFLTFERFPPVLILVGTQEILLDDSRIFYDAIRKIQQRTTLHIVLGQTHVWMLTNIEHADSKRALSQMKAFMAVKGD